MEDRLDPNLEKGINPCCGYITDSVDTLPEFSDDLPEIGDVVLCLNCGTLLIATKPGTANVTRLATRKDLEWLNAKQRRYVHRAQQYIFRRGRLHEPGLS